MSEHYKVVGYAVDGSLRDIRSEDLLKLTHLNIAFGRVIDDGIRINHMKDLDQLAEIKRVNPELNVLLSVGGWSGGGFSKAASTEKGRQTMAETAIDILKNHPFDGIDLDWEYPCYGEAGIDSSPEDKENFTALLKVMRARLDQLEEETGHYYLQTIAVGSDQYYIDGTEMNQVQKYLDYVQLMTYDMRGGFQTLTGHHTNLYTPTGDLFRISVEKSVELFLEAGVPREKLIIGAAFYSRMWKDVPNVNNGYLQMTERSGGYGPSFTDLYANYINLNGYKRFFDEEAKAPYLFDGETFITYDDETSITHKCEYVMKQELGGLMFWEYSSDKTYRLLEAIDKGFKQ